MADDQAQYVEKVETAIEVACWDWTDANLDIWHGRRWRQLLTSTGKEVYKAIKSIGLPFRRDYVCEWDAREEVGIFIIPDNHAGLLKMAMPSVVFKTYESGDGMSHGCRLVDYYPPKMEA